MQYLVGKEIQFTPKIEDMEAYPEGGMRAKIKSVSGEDVDNPDLKEHVWKIEFDYTDFDEFNKQFEIANYYGIDHVPNKTAREVNQYEVVEKIYFGSPELFPFEDYFVLLNKRQTKLLDMFKASGEKNYVEWLENQVNV